MKFCFTFYWMLSKIWIETKTRDAFYWRHLGIIESKMKRKTKPKRFLPLECRGDGLFDNRFKSVEEIKGITVNYSRITTKTHSIHSWSFSFKFRSIFYSRQKKITVAVCVQRNKLVFYDYYFDVMILGAMKSFFIRRQIGWWKCIYSSPRLHFQ